MDLIETILGLKDGKSQTPEVLYRVHRKHGQPFALIPSGGGHGLACLLPAQSVPARIYRSLAEFAEIAGIPFPLETRSLRFDESSSFVQFLHEVGDSRRPPMLLPGNPNGPAPRLVVIALGTEGRPSVVIKAGGTGSARELVRRESHFLKSLSSRKGIPVNRGILDDVGCTAFAMDFAEGKSPPWSANPDRLKELLVQWINDSKTMRVREAAPWHALEQSLEGRRPFWLEQFADTMIHPCIFHGDFAPWNVRVDPNGTWMVIDWERGELEGMPGWDWLHFVLQPAILVRKWDVGRVRELAEATISSPEFLHYLGASFPEGLSPGTPQALLRGYFLYNWNVLQPTEERTVQEVLSQVAS